MQENQPIKVKSITVMTGRLVCEVEVPDESNRYATPDLAARIVRQFPTIEGHACVNDAGSTFGCVMNYTSTPHLLEHIAIELQTRQATQPNASFAGTTEWINEPTGVARVQVSFYDDLQALRAFNEATQFLNTAMLL